MHSTRKPAGEESVPASVVSVRRTQKGPPDKSVPPKFYRDKPAARKTSPRILRLFAGRIDGRNRRVRCSPPQTPGEKLLTGLHACCDDLPLASECAREASFGGRFPDAQGGRRVRCFGRAAASQNLGWGPIASPMCSDEQRILSGCHWGESPIAPSLPARRGRQRRPRLPQASPTC
jgi:hypothetical protein